LKSGEKQQQGAEYRDFLEGTKKQQKEEKARHSNTERWKYEHVRYKTEAKKNKRSSGFATTVGKSSKRKETQGNARKTSSQQNTKLEKQSTYTLVVGRERVAFFVGKLKLTENSALVFVFRKTNGCSPLLLLAKQLDQRLRILHP
jgi:hypothetical protein